MAWTDMTALTGLVAWYKPETLAATYANGDPISTWADSSGNSRDLTGTTTTRPLAAASSINGYMAADFDGTDDVLSSASYTHSGNTVVTLVVSYDTLKNYNSLVAIDAVSGPSHPCWFFTSWGYSNGDFIVGNDGAGTFRYYTFENTWGGTPDTATTNYVVTMSFSGLGQLLRANGAQASFFSQQTGDPNSPSSGTAYIHMGFVGLASSYLDGKVCEAIIWTPTADYTEVPWVEGYLADKYAITLADGHLFKNAAPENAPTTYNAAGGATLATDARIERLK